MKKTYLLIIGLIVFAGCEVKPVAINYGADACRFCKMTIVDKQHASQVVTVKGKAFKYDAIECMMNDLAQWSEADPELFLVTDFEHPKTLVHADTVSYLISENIPSPMGANLSAFASIEGREKAIKENGGDALSWSDLKVKFKVE